VKHWHWDRVGLLAAVSTGVLLAGAVLELRSGQSLEARVTRVYDGDTVEALVSGRREKIRYIGIDTPEMDDPRPAVLEMAREAARANRELVGGRIVRLELDIEQRDRFGRLLAYVWLGDTLVNEWLVSEGYAAAPSFPPNVRYQDRLRDAEQDARVGERRLWDGRLAGGPIRFPDGEVGSGAREGSTSRPGDGPRIAAYEGAAFEGRVVTVCDSVASARFQGPGRRTFLNLARPYPDQPFTLVVPYEIRQEFDWNPEELFEHRNVCAAGKVTLYRGKPEITIFDPAQIRPR